MLSSRNAREWPLSLRDIPRTLVSNEPAPPTRPRFSLIAAVYNVARYLPEFIDSIEQQTFPLERLQVIVVDDGSTDDSLTLLKSWSERRPDLVTVLSQQNGGQGSARNLGLEHATGEWLTFPDPDDYVDKDYFEKVDEFLRLHRGSTMIATNRIVFDEATNERKDNHPLKRFFDVGDRQVDLREFPEFFHGAVNAGFFRADLVEREQLRFDVRVRPNFEDGHYCSRYLLATDEPVIGFIKSARYVYRRRSDRSSTVQTALLDPDRFLAAPRYGHLDALRRGVEQHGEAPEWLQNFILYELSWYFEADARMSDVATAAHGEVAERFVETLREIAGLLSPRVIESFALRRFDRVWREILLHAFAGEDWATPYAVVTRTDGSRDAIRVAYRYIGALPDEKITVRGRTFMPVDAKTRTHEFWGQGLLKERLVWLPGSGTLRMLLNGEAVDLRAEWPGRTMTSMRPAQRERLLNPPQPAGPQLSRADRAILRAAHSKYVRAVFGDAWVLLDRLHNADDNAERLFRYLRKSRRDINAWFVIEKGTPDWERLRADGYKRVVPYGSPQWKLLMLNCRHLISSHADVPVMRPTEIAKFGPPQWKFSFLQHGVIKDDISRWLNPKAIDLFVTSTVDEHESIAGDNTPYVFTTLETKMTGLPRFDRLRALGGKVKPGQRKYILVTPTWRQWLSRPKEPGTHRRAVTEDFFDSEYLRQWLAFLRDDRLRAIVERTGLRVAFLPHPNVQPALPDIDVPSYVTAFDYEGRDVQQLMADAAVMVTDYSSMAFNLAYIERPVVYFQFDSAAVLGGGHTGRYGYFDYVAHGFGPVAETVDDAVDALDSIIASGGVPAARYLQRIHRTFPHRDGKCCQRTVEAIEAMDKPVY